MKAPFILLLISLSCNSILSWGPFPTCGPANPSSLSDCDKYSTLTNVGCCLVTLQDSSNTKQCVYIGGKAQGLFNNRTAPVSLTNLTFLQPVLNYTDANMTIYQQNIATLYPNDMKTSGVVKCVGNISNMLLISLVFLLVTLVLIL